MADKEDTSKQLDDSEMYRAIFENSLTANLILSTEGKIVEANPEACRLFGYDNYNLTGTHVSKLLDSNEITNIKNKPEAFAGRAVGLKANGTRIICNVLYSVFESQSGEKFATLQIDDNSEQSKEFENLKLFESVVKNTSDAVVIIKSRPTGRSSRADILFVNEAYTKLTGYNYDELIGEEARFLNAPKSSRRDLAGIRIAIENNEPIETELLTYKKNGDEFWVHVTISPVFDGYICTHFIAIAKDITERKNREQLRFLQSDISRIFNDHKSLSKSIDKTLDLIVGIGDFSLAEIWIADQEKKTISMFGHKSVTSKSSIFYENSADVQAFAKGEGLPGITWETGETQFWRDLKNHEDFIRKNAAATSEIKTAYGIPVHFNNEVTAVLLLGVSDDQQNMRYYTPLLEHVANDLGTELHRKKTEEQLDRIFSFSPDIICVAGMDGYFKQINPAMSRLLGYSQDELLTQPISSFTHPDDRLKTENEIDALNLNEGANSFQNRFITKSGKVVWLSWTTRTFFEEGKIYSIARDVTEQKELETLLRQANRMSKIGAWEYDVLEEEVTWSEVVCQIHEMPIDYNPSLENGIDFYKEGYSRDKISKELGKAVNTGQSFDLELELVTGKGNTRWVRVIGEAEVVQGRVKKIYGSFQDIDQRKTAELRQQELSQEREQILESIGDAFFAVNSEWIVTYWNNLAEEVLGLPRENIVGKNLWDVFDDAVDLEFYRQYHIAMNEGVSVTFEEYYPTAEIWFEVSAYPSRDGLSIFFKDVTHRKKTEQQMIELNKELKKQTEELAASNAELEQFAFVASHDLQEPLRMVTSFLTQLEKKYGDELDERAKKYIWFATDGAKRMRQIILDLLNYSRIGRVETDPGPVDLNYIMQTVVRDFNKTIEEKNAEINWSLLPVITADESSMQSVMRNLIGNALKYHEDGKHPVINVTGEETDTSFKISITDNGIGIAPEYKEKIFQIFQRLHSNDEYSGTGIGLANCKKIIENHGGNISVSSSEGAGSTFTFEIPKKTANE
jgi:PAS domain S-box-containing protein